MGESLSGCTFIRTFTGSLSVLLLFAIPVGTPTFTFLLTITTISCCFPWSCRRSPINDCVVLATIAFVPCGSTQTELVLVASLKKSPSLFSLYNTCATKSLVRTIRFIHQWVRFFRLFLCHKVLSTVSFFQLHNFTCFSHGLLLPFASFNQPICFLHFWTFVFLLYNLRQNQSRTNHNPPNNFSNPFISLGYDFPWWIFSNNASSPFLIPSLWFFFPKFLERDFFFSNQKIRNMRK